MIRVLKGDPPYIHRKPKTARMKLYSDRIEVIRPDGCLVACVGNDKSTFHTMVESKIRASQIAETAGYKISENTVEGKIYHMELETYMKEKEGQT